MATKVLAAFSGFPLAVGKDAGSYNAMDKGRAFLQWGYYTGRFQEAPLDEAMFDLLTSMQQKGKPKSGVTDALS